MDTGWGYTNPTDSFKIFWVLLLYFSTEVILNWNFVHPKIWNLFSMSSFLSQSFCIAYSNTARYFIFWRFCFQIELAKNWYFDILHMVQKVYIIKQKLFSYSLHVKVLAKCESFSWLQVFYFNFSINIGNTKCSTLIIYHKNQNLLSCSLHVKVLAKFEGFSWLQISPDFKFSMILETQSARHCWFKDIDLINLPPVFRNFQLTIVWNGCIRTFLKYFHLLILSLL